MKSIFVVITLSFFYALPSTYAQTKNLSSRDSITTFYDDFLNALESRYLDRNKVNWNELRKYAFENALAADNFVASLKATTLVFDSIGCNHCLLFVGEKTFASTLNEPLSQDDFSREFLIQYEAAVPAFEARLIQEDIAYINMPGMLMINLTQDSLDRATQKMYDEIADLWKENSIKGWVIDLRFNGGGNVYPMLAALHSLLGDAVVYNTIDRDGQLATKHSLKDGGFYSGEKLETKAKVTMEANTNIPVALIIGKMTGSAGEDIAVAFKNRKNVTFIGTRSYGLLSANDLEVLPFNAKFAITTSLIADSNNKYRPYIDPDKEVIKKDNFQDFTKDENIIQAIQFIKKNQ